ncbi:tetratricopeptide repeat protein [Desulfonatronovibrio magnus]|uniref:O-linked N-acetylglucosamine transferase family protein n=1 Tax=Desulfonatronovibrio magnus TaxID=698827 RepID=UPI0005EB0CC9|nr:tetratricopeptide repeat protein [Desulfonatronovibrio magnus]
MKKIKSPIAGKVDSLLKKIQIGNKSAILKLEKLAEQKPNNPYVLHAMGCLSLEKGQGKEALEFLQKAIDKGYPLIKDVWRNQLIASAMCGNLDAFNVYWAKIEKDRPNLKSRVEPIKSAYKAARFHNHKEVLDRVLDIWALLTPEDPSLTLSRIAMKLDQGEDAQAREMISEIPEIKEDDFNSLMLACQLCDRAKDPKSYHYLEQAYKGVDKSKPNDVQRLISMATKLKEYNAAEKLLDELVERNPDLYESKIYDMLAIFQESCQWSKVEKLVPEYMDAVSNERINPPGLWKGLSWPGITDADHLKLANKFVTRFAKTDPPPESVSEREPRNQRKLKVGYMSADFMQHPVIQLIMEVLERHDHTQYELIAFDVTDEHESFWRRRVLSAFDKVIPVRKLNETELVETIRQENVDIIIDLQGDTTDTRCWSFRHRLAPVQMSWLGFIGTIGEGISDYILADPHTIPARNRQYFAEKVIWMPDFCFPADTQREAPPPPPRIVENLPGNAVVFCSFNGHYKITRETFETWIKIVLSVEGSVLWLYNQHPASTGNLQKAALELGLPENRIFFAGHRPHTEHLARLQLADVALDSWPYNSGATAIDTLWCGVPMVSYMGETMMSRVAGGMLHTLGLPELACSTVDQFRDTAIELGNNPQKRREMKDRLLQARYTSPLYNPGRFVRHLEKAFEMAYSRFEQKLPPNHIEVPVLEDAQTATAKTSVQVLLEKADYYLNQDKLDRAQDFYEQAAAQDPDNPYVLYGQGMILGLRGKYQDSLELLRKAVDSKPEHKPFQKHMEIMEKKAEQNRVGQLSEVLSKGMSLHQQGRMDEALECYQTILEDSPLHPQATHYLGLLELQKGSLEGLDKIKASIQLQPYNQEFQHNYAKACQLAENLKQTNNQE